MTLRVPLTLRERQILVSEIRSATSDSRALIGSFLGALSFLSLAEIRISLPPLAWLFTKWSKVCELFWNYALSWLPFEVHLSTLTTDSTSFFMVVGFMFLRGHYAGYAGQNQFSIRAQDFFARLMYYLLIAFGLIRVRGALYYLLQEPRSSESYWGIILGAFLILITGFYLFRRYVLFLRKARVIPRLLARPWLIFLGPILILILQGTIPSEIPRSGSEDLTIVILMTFVMLSNLFVVLFLFFFGAPIASWFVRIIAAMVLTAASLFALDLSWSLLSHSDSTVGDQAASAPQAISTVNEDRSSRGQEVISQDEGSPLARSGSGKDQATSSTAAGANIHVMKPAIDVFFYALEMNGTPGSIELVTGCYSSLEKGNTLALLDRCLAIDLLGVKYYSVFARYYEATSQDGLDFFSGEKSKIRMILACNLRDIDPEPCRQRVLDIDDLLKPEMENFISNFWRS